MSTTATSPIRDADAAATVPTRLRLTTRGRRVLAGALALPIAATLAWAALGSSAAQAGSAEGAPAGTFETVVVEPGDSLWHIAQEVAPGRDARDVVDEIVDLNALPSSLVTAGQELAVPTMEK